MSISNIFFTADLHFNHRNIIKYCHRPFKDIHEMNRALVDNWNSVVPDNGLVCVLGDFSFYNSDFFASLLNGEKIFIKGNHDRQGKGILPGLLCNFDGLKVYMNHYPFSDYDDNKANLILCGHVHDKWKTKSWKSKPIINVGVDVWDFKPVALELIYQEAQLTKVLN